MNTLRQAVHEYLEMRRNLGFKLDCAGKLLLDFVTFMEQHQAPYVTETLALAWGTTTSVRKAGDLGTAPESCTCIRALSSYHRSTYTNSIAGFIALSTQAGETVSIYG